MIATIEDLIINNLESADKKIYDTEYINCTFNQCVFSDCRFINSAFYDCAFINCQLISIVFDNSLMNVTDFVNCKLIGIRWDSACGMGSKSRPIKSLRNCVLDTNVAEGISFLKMSFESNVIRNTVFSNCDLMGCSFKNDDLSATSFTGCNLKNADFQKSRGYRIDIRSNQLRGARFSLPEAKSLLESIGVVVS